MNIDVNTLTENRVLLKVLVSFQGSVDIFQYSNIKEFGYESFDTFHLTRDQVEWMGKAKENHENKIRGKGR